MNHDRGQLSVFVLVVVASVSLVVFAITMLFTMDVAGEFAGVLSPIVSYPVEGVGSETITDGVGNAYMLLGLGAMSIPAAVLGYILLGNRPRKSEPREPKRL